MRTAAIHSGARRRYGILGTAIVVGTRGRTPVRVGVFVDVCVGAEGARAVKPLRDNLLRPECIHGSDPSARVPLAGVTEIKVVLKEMMEEEYIDEDDK